VVRGAANVFNLLSNGVIERNGRSFRVSRAQPHKVEILNGIVKCTTTSYQDLRCMSLHRLYHACRTEKEDAGVPIEAARVDIFSRCFERASPRSVSLEDPTYWLLCLDICIHMPLCAVGFDAERNQRTFFYRIDAGNYCFCKEICIGDNMVGRGPATRAIPVHSHRGLVGAAFLRRLAREDCILTANLQRKLSSDFKTSWNLDEEERASNRVEKLLFLGSSRFIQSQRHSLCRRQLL
jgi:hypothetical protein